jgi:flavin reductase (DIM6/NTAB) family NADH-FMN oxidoreductase RutF
VKAAEPFNISRLALREFYMSIIQQTRELLKTLVFGNTLLPQEFTLGMVDPQAEISVWLHGAGEPLDVTRRHSTVCSDPFTICVSFAAGCQPDAKRLRSLSLHYRERSGDKRLLGEIGLKYADSISLPGMELLLFRAGSANNYCLPPLRLCAHYLMQAYSQWRKPNTSGLRMSFLDQRAAIVTFIRAHPVTLVSSVDASGGNIFPMNLMGELGNGRFAFALKDSRRAAHLVERTRRVALSSVPMSQAALAFRLALNHFKDSIVWEELPFATRVSIALKIPVPAFTPRVREMLVEKVHPIGSHTLFVATMVHEETLSKVPELCVIHGFYQAWRLRNHRAELQASVRKDSLNKGLRVEGESGRCTA